MQNSPLVKFKLQTAAMSPKERITEKFTEEPKLSDEGNIPQISSFPVRLLTQAEPLSFSSLPYDIHHTLFGHLDIVTSTCLGLTCKKLYAIHRKYHSKPDSLKCLIILKGRGGGLFYLGNLITKWMGKGMKFSYHMWKFVTKER
jgi:hypothetical protein